MNVPAPATLLRKGDRCRVCAGPIVHGNRINFHRDPSHGERVAHSDCGFWNLDELSADEKAALMMLDRREKVFSKEMWRALMSLWFKGVIRVLDRDKPNERYLVTLLALPLIEKLRKVQAATSAGSSPPELTGVAASTSGGRP